MSNSNAKPTSGLHLMTIGVYGADEDSFFGALTNAGVDTFCDVSDIAAYEDASCWVMMSGSYL